MTKLLNKNISENKKSLKIFITNIGEDYETLVLLHQIILFMLLNI